MALSQVKKEAEFWSLETMFSLNKLCGQNLEVQKFESSRGQKLELELGSIKTKNEKES